jgi:uncharacterized protein with PIN domain
MACQARFHAWNVAPRNLMFASCPRCGNLDLQKILKERAVDGTMVWLKRAANFSAYRCEPCRWRFFSLRPLSGMGERIREKKQKPA